MKKEITYDDYLRLLGLMKLAADSTEKVRAIEEAAAAIVDEENDGGYFGHVSDEIWGREGNADDMLKRMGIKVLKKEKVPKKKVK